MSLLICGRLGDQFIYVPQTILSGFLILIPQIFCIIDPFQQRFDQIRQPDLNMLIQIAQFGGTSLDDLATKDLTPPVPLYVRNMVSLRKKCVYSQGELATVLGLQGASSIDLVESGKCELPVSKLVHLAEFFGVTKDQITKQDLSQEVSGCRQQ